MGAIGDLFGRLQRRMQEAEDDYDYDEEDYLDDEEEDSRGSSYRRSSRNYADDEKAAKKPMSKVTSIKKRLNTENDNVNGNIYGIKPKTIEDAKLITDTLLEGKTVVLNLETTNSDIAERILDYSYGTTYALNGIMQKISNSIYIIVPYGIEITGAFHEYMSSSEE